MRLKKTETKRVNESIEDDLFEEWVDSLDYDLIRNMIIPSDKLDEAVRDFLDESTSDEEIVDSIRNSASDWLEGNSNVEEYCISLLNDSKSEIPDLRSSLHAYSIFVFLFLTLSTFA